MVDLLDLISYLDLVLYGQIARIKKLIKLYNFVENSFFKWCDGCHALIFLTAHFFWELLVVEIRVDFESVYEPFLWLVAIWGVDHGQSSSSANYENAR